MKFRLLDLLNCPHCKNNFYCDVHVTSTVNVLEERKTSTCKFWCSFKNINLLKSDVKITDCEICQEIEIVEGVLKCACSKSFPITNGIPRILPPSLEPIKKRTAKKFGYEWTRFSDYDVNNFGIFLKFLEPSFFNGKVGLDVGCGAGRHLLRISDLGAEVVGFDLSNAVDVAYQKTFRLSNVHIVQCDIYYPPFRESAFDFISSLGVLHHLSDPSEGFRRLIPFLNPEGGTIFFLVYQRSLRKLLLEPIRRITTHLPEKIVYWISLIAAIFDYGIGCQSYCVLRKIPFLNNIVDLVTPDRIREYSRYSFKVNLTDWFDRLSAPISHFYSQGEIRKWLSEASLTDIRTSLINSSWVYGYGVRRDTQK